MKGKSRRGKFPQRERRDNLPATAVPAEPAPVLSPRRKLFFRLIAMVCVPLVLLGGLELILRLTGYGYRTSFFETTYVGNQKYLRDNEDFALRFFPPQLTRWPTPILIPAVKPTNTFRIFVLGESAAQGDPEPAFGAWRYLEVLLHDRYPGENFEVVNVAVTAINSNVILPIARECARHQGDLWILYMGNNEMVGPFGAATVFGAKAPPWWMVRMDLALQKTRVGQLTTSLMRKFRSSTANASWGGMEMFVGNQVAPDDPRRTVVYQNFQHNLREILRAGLNSGAKIVLNTVAINLKDCPPFASSESSQLTAAARARFESQLAEAKQLQAQSNFTAAAQLYETAAKGDDTFAELQYRWGECLLGQGEFASARDHFQLACDDDALPFRADSRINGLIQRVGQQFAGSNLDLFDSAGVLETGVPSRIPGQETFYEHVHFNFDGSYRLARAWADQVQRFLPDTVKNRGSDSWASQEACEQLLGLTDWNRALVLQETVLARMQQPPLSTQFNNEWRVQVINRQLQEIHQRMTATNAEPDARAIYQIALNRSPGDYMLHENYAEFLQYIGDSKQSASEWLEACRLSPYNAFAFCQEGRVLARMGRAAEAQAALAQSIALHPRYFDAWLELGYLHFAQRDYQTALQDYDQARALQPNDYRAYYEMGRAFSLLKRSPESVENFRRAIRLNPAYWEAHYGLGGELGMQGNVLEAKSEFEKVIRLAPGFAPAHLNLGVALMKQNDLADAAREFQAALNLDPSNHFAASYLNQIQSLQKTNP